MKGKAPHCHWWKGHPIAIGGEGIQFAYCKDIVRILHGYYDDLIGVSSVYHKDDIKIIRRIYSYYKDIC